MLNSQCCSPFWDISLKSGWGLAGDGPEGVQVVILT